MEQQLPTGPRERQIAELVEHDHLEPGELSSQGPGLADPGLFLGAALELNPSGVIVVRASPASRPATTKRFGGLILIGLRSVTLLQSEVSRNDLANAWLVNDMLAARDQLFAGLEAAGVSAVEAGQLLLPLDQQLAAYRFAQIRVIEPEEEFSDTLEFDPVKIRRAIDAGRAAVEREWPAIERLLR